MPVPGRSLTFWDIGQCNCSSCSFFPCVLPKTNLTLTIAGPSTGGIGTGIFTSSPSTGCLWTSGCINLPGMGSIRAFWGVSVFLCSFFTTNNSTLPGCSGVSGHYFWDHPTGCGLITGTPMTLVSFTCSPLSITFTQAIPSLNFTITP